MGWGLAIDDSGTWINVELSVGDWLKYVEMQFSGNYMMRSMTAT